MSDDEGEDVKSRFGESHIRLLEDLLRADRPLHVDSPACGVYVGLVADGLVRLQRAGDSGMCVLSITWEGLMTIATTAKKEHETPRTNGDVGLRHLAIVVDFENRSLQDRKHAFIGIVKLLVRLRNEEIGRKREA